MSIVAELIARLIVAGTPADVAAVAVAEAFTAGVRSAEIPRNSADVSAEKRREKDRIRKRVAAENLRNSAENAEIPQNSNSALSSSLNSETQGKGRKEERAEPRKRPRNSGERLPDGWQPSAEHFAQGAELKISREAVTGMAQDMRLWAKANEHRAIARKSNWDLTFSGWMRREAPKHRGRGPPGSPGNSFADVHRDLLDNAHGGSHDSPSFADFESSGYDLDLTANPGR